jgi:hypothetical protein
MAERHNNRGAEENQLWPPLTHYVRALSKLFKLVRDMCVGIMKSKKGIAPLIATFLLVGLAIGLGILVMNFGRAQIEIAAQCAVDLGLQVVNLNDKPQACFDRVQQQIFFIVENGQQLPVEKLKLRVIGESDVLSQDIPDSRIDRLGTMLKNIPYNLGKFGEVRQIRLIPEIQLYDEIITCTEQALSFENVRDCE